MLSQIDNRVRALGLQIQSVFAPDADDGVPSLSGGEVPATLVLVGNAGSAIWPHFSASPEYADGCPDPLDRWSARIGKTLAGELGAEALFPFNGPPFYPFLSWARRADPSVVSPLGLSLHPRFGLWHACRFALALPHPLKSPHPPELPAGSPASPPQQDPAPDLCQSCSQRPCLSACPVDAFTGSDYRHRDCAAFLAANPQHHCNSLGCAARRACPVGREYQYAPEHARFHMQIFVARHS